MSQASVFQGRYFDGQSANAHDAQIIVAQHGLIIETADDRHNWNYADMEKAPAQGDDVRLVNQNFPDALLVLPLEAQHALGAAAPDLFSTAAANRRMTGLIATLIVGSAAVAALLFFGVPAASGPLARATPKSFEMQIGENLAAQINTLMRSCNASEEDENQQGVADGIADILDLDFRPCGNEEASALITPVIDEMAAAGEVGFNISFQFVRSRMPNAFALPGGQVMATCGLLDAVSEDQEAFLAVMAHELGHVRARDSMQAVYRNAGLGILLEVITGGSGVGQQLVLIGGQLNQLRHTRKQETAADEAAVDIMVRSNLDPSALARAFEAIVGEIRENDGGSEEDQREIPTWLHSHPDTQERIDYANSQRHEGGPLPLTPEEWAIVSKACATNSDEDSQDSDDEEIAQ